MCAWNVSAMSHNMTVSSSAMIITYDLELDKTSGSNPDGETGVRFDRAGSWASSSRK